YKTARRLTPTARRLLDNIVSLGLSRPLDFRVPTGVHRDLPNTSAPRSMPAIRNHVPRPHLYLSYATRFPPPGSFDPPRSWAKGIGREFQHLLSPAVQFPSGLKDQPTVSRQSTL